MTATTTTVPVPGGSDRVDVTLRRLTVDGVGLNVATAGRGPAVLLQLHGVTV
ncbi:alpha/beta hydrolase, partial [Streptomyces sp. SID5998]|nr:alpha/beta hydrolase [Streptomyces sp. SID5998]